MKYIISESRMLGLVKNMVNLVNPHFNVNDVGIATYINGNDTYLEYYDKDGKPVVFARFYVWTKELQLNVDLFRKLENFLGEELMTGVIDWFNEEFDQDAETVTY